MNYNLKNSAILEIQAPGLGLDIVFVKENLLYLPENKLAGFKEVKATEAFIMNRLFQPDAPAAGTYKPLAPMPEQGGQPDHPVKASGAKTSFLVFKNQKYTTVQTDQIAFFYVRNEGVSMMCFDQQEYTLNQSLDQITGSVSSAQFFRVNRKYLISFKAIKEVEHYFLRKLFVKLRIDTPEKLLIHKEKTNAFLSWMGDR